MRNHRKTYKVLVFVLILAAAVGAKAQTYYGSVRGLIMDKQGATLSQATVTLTNEATHIKRTAETNNAGEYVFTALDPATYSLTVEANGFKKHEEKNLIIATQQSVTLDVTLTLGEMSQVVEVTATSQLIDNSTASNGLVIDSQKLENLPNAGRNPFFFSKLDNNVTQVGDPRFVRFQDQSGSSQISLAGGPISGNNYEIDNIPITDFSNRAVIIPSIEAVNEVKVQQNSYDAEMGRTGGGVFNTTLKSGSNALHGVLQGETRQTNWGANLFFNNHSTPQIPRGAAEFYSYVGAIGGPIWIPHVYDGRNKTFFWITEEGYRQRSPLTASNSFVVPTALERAGDFSQTLTQNPTTKALVPLNIYDPATAFTGGSRKQFSVANGNAGLHNGIPTDNIIPTARLNQVGVALANAYPIGAQGLAYGTNNFTGGDTLGDRADEFVGKIDHQVLRRWQANVSYMHYGSKEPGGNALQSFAGSSSSYLLYRKVDAFAVNNTITVSPTMIVTAGFGFNRFPNNTLDISNGFDQSTLGFPSSYVTALQKKAFPQITNQSLATEGTLNSGPAVFYSRNFVLGVSKSLGKHELKAGYVYRSISVTFTNVGTGNGTYAFDSSYTSSSGSKTPATGSTPTGADTASMVLGLASSGSVILTTQLALNVPYNALYIQDDYRITPKLSVNYGLRYENEPGIHERSNHYAVGLDPTVKNPATTAPNTTILGGVEFAGVNGYPTACCNSGNKFAPRAGFAYSLLPTTVVRGGFGVFYSPLVYSTSPSYAPGYTQTNSLVAASSTAPVPASYTLSNPFPNGLVGPTGNSLGYATGVGSSLTLLDSNRHAPIVMQYSADIQQDLGYGFALKVGYVGAHAKNLPLTTNINQLPDKYLSLGQTALLAKVPNPYYKAGGAGLIGQSTIPYEQTLLPYPQYTTISDSVSVGYSNYNALDLKLQKRFSHGFTLLTALTWSSNWDNSWGASNTLNPGNNGPQDWDTSTPTAYQQSIKSEYSRAINDIPVRYTITGSYDLPFGRGKMFLGGAGRLVDMAVGGWTFNDVTIIQNGMPLPVTQVNANAVTGANGTIGGSVQRPNMTGVQPCYSGSPESRLTNYINTAAFSAAPVFTYGNAPRTTSCYGPGYLNTDLSLNKTFKVTERVNAQFRAEALNAFNTPQFNGFGASNATQIQNVNFGQIQGTLGFPRLVQLGGRITF
jgi:trimeric autotransporter adhesin